MVLTWQLAFRAIFHEGSRKMQPQLIVSAWDYLVFLLKQSTQDRYNEIMSNMATWL